jgi:hypothetical protein
MLLAYALSTITQLLWDILGRKSLRNGLLSRVCSLIVLRDIIGFDAKSTVEARYTLLLGNQERELDKLLVGIVCLFRPTDMNYLCQEC